MSHSIEEKILLNKGIKPTPNRILIIRELLKTDRAISIGDLETMLEFTMDKASIFRVLELFSDKDVVHEVQDGTRSLKYELCHSLGHHSIWDQHVHFYCERCNETYCFEDKKVPLIEMPEGFTARNANYLIKGICPKCEKKISDKP